MASNALKFADEVPLQDVAAEAGTAGASLTNLGPADRASTAEQQQAGVPSVQASKWQQPAAYFERRMFTDGALTMPDGETIRFWGFQDPKAAAETKALPSPTIRVQEGETVHIKLEVEKAAADCAAGMKTASHVYQWQPKGAGTWLYQSHESSLRQFEMGLFGLLIVDPEPDADGKARAYRGGPAYDIERCWVLDDVDPVWHGASAVGQSAMAEFCPKYFLVNGIANVDAYGHSDVAVDARAGDKVLLRLLNASFSLVRMKIEKLKGDIISVDGKALATPDRPWTKWNPVNAGQSVYMATGARHDLLIDLDPARNPVSPGDEFLVTFEFLDFAKRQVRNADAQSPLYVGRAQTRIRIV